MTGTMNQRRGEKIYLRRKKIRNPEMSEMRSLKAKYNYDENNKRRADKALLLFVPNFVLM